MSRFAAVARNATGALPAKALRPFGRRQAGGLDGDPSGPWHPETAARNRRAEKGGKGENEILQAVETAPQVQPVAVLNDFREVPIYALQESPTNPRRSFDEGKLIELSQSIRSQGVLVPLIVRELDMDRFEVVAGARRFRAARLAELASLPVRVVQLTDTQVLEYQLIENAIREDVHPYEEAMAYKALLETSEPRYDVASIAAKTGRSVTHVYQRLRLAELIPEAAEAFQANQITAGHAILIPQDQQKGALDATFRED